MAPRARGRPVRDITCQRAKERTEFMARMKRARSRRQRDVEHRQSALAAAAVERYRVERARGQARGIPVLPTIDEFRRRLPAIHQESTE